MKINEFNANQKILKYFDKLDYFFNRHKTLVSLELDLTNECDGKCPKCTGIKEKKCSLSFSQVKKLIDDLKIDFDAKSIIISGGGEPLLNKDFGKILYYIKSKGLSIGLNTNGLSLNKEKAKTILECCKYVRVSLDAGSNEIYELTHGLGEKEFEKVIKNIKVLTKLKKEISSNTSIGTGFLTNKETSKNILNFFELSKQCSVDFAQLRPFTGDLTPTENYVREGKKLYESSSFKIAYSKQKYDRFNEDIKRPYKKCGGMFFNTVITADFKVFACLHHRQKNNYFLGDLNKSSLKQIWNSSRILNVFEKINFEDCPVFCRNDDINRMLEELDNPINHQEFL